MPEIQRSVGRNGHNDVADVTIVQRLLNAVPPGKGGPDPILDIDGSAGPRTVAAIKRSQTAQLQGISDGLVQPGHKTIGALNAAATAPGARAVPDPDLDPATQAKLDAFTAGVWGTVALRVIKEVEAHVERTGGISGFDQIVVTALAGHFHIDATMSKARIQSLLTTIESNYTAALVEIASGTHYRSVSRSQMHHDLARNASHEAPGYTPFPPPRRICWSPLFHALRGAKPGYDWAGAGFGSRCRAAMVLHEPIHFVDKRADFDTYEWGPEYTRLTADRAVHNASSYPSFGAHVFERSNSPLGPRYGAGRPAD